VIFLALQQRIWQKRIQWDNFPLIGGQAFVCEGSTRASSAVAAAARRILLTGKGRRDFLAFVDVPTRSELRLPYESATEKAIADLIVSLIGAHDSSKELLIGDENGQLVLEGPYFLFESARKVVSFAR
jgi:hypothetical protein